MIKEIPLAKAEIRWNTPKDKYELVFQGKVLVSSQNFDYLNYVVAKQKNSQIIKLGITEYSVTSHKPDGVGAVITDLQGVELTRPTYSITKRFGFMDQMVDMVINKNAKSIFITGEGGIGKTYTVLKRLELAGKVDVMKITTPIDILKLSPNDSEAEMRMKALTEINAPKGDFVLIKGRSTAAALFRSLYENRDKTIIFDDCDSVFKDQTGCSILKSALDSYEERRVYWMAERPDGHDLPQSFLFEGQIIFISNTPLSKVEESIKTRCLKVDLSMSKAQRIEWMGAVLHDICPSVHIKMKKEALKLLEDNMHLTNDINFRSLMSVISIRADINNKNWKELATYALTEQ